MYGIYVLVLYGGGFTVLAVATLLFVPPFRFTLVNVFLFDIGAVVGMFALVNVVGRGLYAVGAVSEMSAQRQYQLVLFLSFLGGLIGGSASVWLKMRLGERRKKVRP